MTVHTSLSKNEVVNWLIYPEHDLCICSQICCLINHTCSAVLSFRKYIGKKMNCMWGPLMKLFHEVELIVSSALKITELAALLFLSGDLLACSRAKTMARERFISRHKGNVTYSDSYCWFNISLWPTLDCRHVFVLVMCFWCYSDNIIQVVCFRIRALNISMIHKRFTC